VSAADELVDVTDEQGVVLRTATRGEVRQHNLWHRSVFVVVLSGEGSALLVHQRADWKDVWPRRWDLAFGGVLDAGEDFVAAAQRELGEEAGLTVTPQELQRLGPGRYADEQVREHAEVFAVRSDGPFTFPDGEVVDSRWVPLAGLDDWLGRRAVCPDTVAIVRPLLGRETDPRTDGDLHA
jgi:8-oxo-dGTP pyrophosphatase MutT (NUDIX family)